MLTLLFSLFGSFLVKCTHRCNCREHFMLDTVFINVCHTYTSLWLNMLTINIFIDHIMLLYHTSFNQVTTVGYCFRVYPFGDAVISIVKYLTFNLRDFVFSIGYDPPNFFRLSQRTDTFYALDVYY